MRYLTQAALADCPITQLQAPKIAVEYINLEVDNLPPELRSIIAGWQALT